MQFEKKFISEPFYGKNQLKFNDAIKGFTELMKKTEHNPEIYPYHSITTYYVLHIMNPTIVKCIECFATGSTVSD